MPDPSFPEQTLSQLFAADPERVARLSARLEIGEGGILFDWSKTHLTDDLLAAYEAQADAAGLRRAAPPAVRRRGGQPDRGPCRRAPGAARRRPRSERRGSGRAARSDAAAGRGDPRGRARRGQPPDPHRHWRLGARARAGGRRAGARFRRGRRPRGLQHRRRRARSGVRRVRSGDHAGRGREQDLLHDRDDDQRRERAQVARATTACSTPTAG